MIWFFGCKCYKIPAWIIANENSRPFNLMQQIAIKTNDFTVLKKCRKCGQHWQIDTDYNVSGLAIKIDDANKWLLLSDFQSRKEAMMERHGGVSGKKCQWADCNNNAMRDMAFCVECAYQHMNTRNQGVFPFHFLKDQRR